MKRLHSIRILAVALFALAATPAHLRAATITVTNTADSGAGTLRAALASANNGDTINFALPAPSTIFLTSPLLVTNNIAIIGPGPAGVSINGNRTNLIF